MSKELADSQNLSTQEKIASKTNNKNLGGKRKFYIFYFFAIVILLPVIITANIFKCFDEKKDINITKKQIEVYKIEADNYYDIIERADRAEIGYYKTTATFNGFLMPSNLFNENNPMLGAYVFKNNNLYYFIVYEYYNIITNSREKGLTCASFTADEVLELNQEIEIVYSKKNDKWISVYSNYKLENNQNYLSEKAKLKDNKIDFVLSIIFLIVFIVAEFVFVILLFIKSLSEIKHNVKNQKSKLVSIDEKTVTSKRKSKKCIYCQSVISVKAKKCDNCGATKFE